MRKQLSLCLATAHSTEPAVQHILWYAMWRAKFKAVTRMCDVNDSPIQNSKLSRNDAHSWTRRVAKLIVTSRSFVPTRTIITKC